MKLCTFSLNTPVGMIRRVGVHTAIGIIDATAARISFLEKLVPSPTASRVGSAQAPADMIAILAGGAIVLEWIQEATQDILSRGASATLCGERTLYDMNEIALLAPVPRPPALTNFNCWPTHIKHANMAGFSLGIPDKDLGPQSFWKGNADSITGPGMTLEYPPYANALDVECELVAVVGIGGKNLSEYQAAKAIAGYTIMNDVSVRDIQMREMKSGRGPAKGKDFDTGNPLGPWLVTSDEVGDPRSLTLSLIVNNEQWSSADGTEMAFTFPQMLSYVSQGQTIYPGHIISGGSYFGGSGFDLKRTLAPGDVVELKISRIGSLINTIGRQSGG
jgi:2-keto-4-pentenoate hydratase/2-oxohepta-3-ene-1,7-dioic acid hydratase in catechol pathway